MQSKLDAIGRLTHIEKGESWWNLRINYDIVMTVKSRETLRKHIVRMHNDYFPKDAISIRKYASK